MPQSWSGIRKRLEQDLLCDKLKDRVKYFITRYRESHDEARSRFAVLVDNKQIINVGGYGCYPISIDEINQGKFTTYNFSEVLDFYLHNPIENSISSENGLIRLLAILDRRVGKRTLLKQLEKLSDQPDWLKPFYTLRLEAEGLH
jgi:hypothetical protein